MKLFQCNNCSHPVFFENTVCEKCGSSLGYIPSQYSLTALMPQATGWITLENPPRYFHYCLNQGYQACNWLIPEGSHHGLCEACRFNKVIPDLTQDVNLHAWRTLEVSKHRLIYSLHRLGLELKNREEEPTHGLAFEFLSDHPDPAQSGVKTGHNQGLITINIAEADSAYREKVRKQMHEPYRTLIGHFRHEVGHYYWERLIQPNPALLGSFRELFGDEQRDYGDALQQYYQQGPPVNWQTSFLTAYATSHPWEDWAEIWAHYLHIIDIMETAMSFGMSLQPRIPKAEFLNMTIDFDPYHEPDFDRILDACLPLTCAVNSLNRSMGQPDLYPFIQPPEVISKLRFVHNLLQLH